MKCLVCKSPNNRLLGFNQQNAIYQCLQCGLGWTEGQFDHQYQAYHRDQTYQEFEEQFKNIFAKRVHLVDQYLPKGRALEIGCSTGVLLTLLTEKGWQTVGVEPSRQAASYARSRGLFIIENTFEKARLENNSFDLAVAGHVLEHVQDPVGFVGKVNKLLLPKGYFLVDVPNFGSLSAKLLGSNWYYVLPTEHRWHFTFAALQKLLTSNGFNIVRWQTASGVFDYANPWLELKQAMVGLKKRFIIDFATLIPSWLLTLANLGTSLTVLARKSD